MSMRMASWTVRRRRFLTMTMMVMCAMPLSSCMTTQFACNGARPTAGFPQKVGLQQARNWAAQINAKRAVEDLQCWSEENDRAAAFALGIRYLEGLDTERNLEKSKALFELAARPVTETRSFYAPPVGGQNYTVPVTVPIAKESVVKSASEEMILLVSQD